MLADEDTDTKGFLLDYFKEYNFFIPSSFGDLFKEQYLSASLAIIDYSFLGNQGVEVLKGLKTARPSLPIIFTSSHCIGGQCFCALKIGARDCFKKPYVLEDIAKSIESLLSSREINERDRTNVLLDKYANSSLHRKASQTIYSNIERTKIYIENNYHEPISLHLLANMACMSVYHFSRTFKKQVGMSCTGYVNKVRIRKSKWLLQFNQFSISRICFMVGYNDLTHFGRVFRKIEGYCPSIYRKKFHPPIIPKRAK